MTATQRRNRTRARNAPPPSRSTWLWVGLVTVVIGAALIAVFASRDSSSPSQPGVAQTRPVQITGAPLPALGSGADPAVGLPIPEVQGAGFDGTPLAITRDGRPKLVMFVAHWCPHCQREVPLIVAHLRTATVPAGVDLFAVSTAASDARPNFPPSAWLADEGWGVRTLVDSASSEASAAFGVSGFPFFVAVDANGNVVARTSGEISMDTFDGLVARAAGRDDRAPDPTLPVR